MPLPDERPRQSVANLIGRFEQQTKRLSTGSPPQRLSALGLASQSTGDSPKDETPPRDNPRREWPPKLNPDDIPPPYTSYWSRTSNIQLALAAPVPQPSTQGNSNIAEKMPNNVPLIADLLATAPTPASGAPELQAQHKLPNDPPAESAIATPTTKPSPRTPVSVVKASSTPRSSLSPKTPASVAKSTSRTSTTPLNNTPTQQPPLKAQLTGHSTTSVSARSNRTPSRSATTSASKAAVAPSNATAGIQRPKTPSSGLFAPTAASIARSRNAPPPPPPPVRKATMSSAAADRLSKPTAASMSKVRQPVATTMATATTTTTTSPPSKKKAPASPPKAAATGSPSQVRPRASPGHAVATSTSTKDVEISETGQQENGHPVEASGHTPQDTQLDELHTMDYTSETGQQENRHPIETSGHTPQLDELHGDDDGRVGDQEDDAAPQDDFSLDKTDGVDHHAKHVDSASHEDPSAIVGVLHEPSQPPHDAQTDLPIAPSSSVQIDTTQDTDGIKPESLLTSDLVQTSHVVDDIADMVNMLESGPAQRRLSITSIPDEVNEIPDEE